MDGFPHSYCPPVAVMTSKVTRGHGTWKIIRYNRLYCVLYEFLLLTRCLWKTLVILSEHH